MLKRNPLIFLALVFAIFALFAVSEVMAQNSDCTAPDSVTCGDCTITAQRGPNNEFPVPAEIIDGVQWYKVEYEYSGAKCDVQSFDHAYYTLEYNECFDDINVRPQTGLDDYAPGAGGGDNDFALGVHSARVIRINPQGNKAYFYVDTKRLGKSSGLWKAGRKQFDCDGPIISVGYDPERPLGALPSAECVDVNGALFMKVVRGPNGCDPTFVDFYLFCPTCDSNAAGCVDLVTGGPDAVLGPVCTSLNARDCPECLNGMGGTSPTYYDYEVNGKKYTVCYDLENPPSYSCP